VRRPAAIAVLLGCLLFVLASSAAATTPDYSFVIGPISAVFNPAARATSYHVLRFHMNGRQTAVTMTWTLHLQLVDKAGAPSPGTPGSGAAVDTGCTNAGVGVQEPQKDVVKAGFYGVMPRFVWHHPDAVDSVPPGRYHCNHDDMGPHGHQGLVKVVVADKEWECTATYRGTNSSTPKSVDDGTASVAKCAKRG